MMKYVIFLQLGEAGSKNLAPVADGFIFHCHGGGFVAQSSRSHETYLCQWVKSIDVPLLSVDYSLAPEAPFPRALEDTFYAYCWALNHLNILGTTGRRIVAAGNVLLVFKFKFYTYSILLYDQFKSYSILFIFIFKLATG